MKRKLAILLAAVMTLAMLPMNLFATSSNSLSKSVISLSGKAGFLEPGILSESNAGSATAQVVTVDDNNDLDYAVDGTYLQFRPSNDVASGTSVVLNLTNAKWHFSGSKWNSGDSIKTENIFKATALYSSSVGADDGYGYNRQYGEYNATTKTYTRWARLDDGTSAGGQLTPIYDMVVSSADETRATITFRTDLAQYESASSGYSLIDANGTKGYICVPLVVRSTSDSDDVKIAVGSNNTTLSGGTWVFATVSDSNTETYYDDLATARDSFDSGKLIIKEHQIGSIEDGSVRISLPSGFDFDSLGNVEIYAENFPGIDSGWNLLTRDNSVAGASQTKYATIAYRQSGGEADESSVIVTFKGLSKTTSLEGIIYITNLTFTADEDAAYGDINATIRNQSGSTVVTNQTFKAGTRKDWTVSLTTTSTIPTLVNGRYEEQDSIDAEDDVHLAASLKFSENVTNSWWANRSTTLTLPEGVKFRKVEITDTDKIIEGNTLEDPSNVYGSGTGAVTSEYYLNTGKKLAGHVTIDGNVMTWTGLNVEATKKGIIEFDVWLSVESGYEGDITMLVGGSGVVDDDQEPVVIAKAVSPVEISTKVTDIKIGYQTYSVADIEITETAAGMLEKNKEVWLTISDRIYDDVYFTPGFEYEVTEGNLKIEDVGIATSSSISVSGGKIKYNDSYSLGSGTISFDIAAESSTASTVKFSNLMLKIDRTVPQSSIGYKVYAWGPNIAPNSTLFDYSKTVIDTKYEGNDQHSAMGISADYLKVVTSALNDGSVLSSVVKVTAGSSTAYVNGNAVTVDPAPFIDVATSRMQVPVRAVATLLGVKDEQILWSDSARTVTINMNNRTIQFTIGSDVMLINGAQVTMDTEAMIQASSGRTFIPFKYLGDALGVTVGYDDSTKTATFNADLEEK